MNFNLISPSDNGSEFTIKFNEHITFEPNSLIQLNFAELVRDKEVILTEQATITMTVEPSDLYPRKVPATNADNLAFGTQTSKTDTETIAKGEYTFTRFQNRVENAIQTLLERSNLQENYEVYIDSNENEAILIIGIQPKDIDGVNNGLSDFTLDTTHGHDGVQTDASGNPISYRTTNNAGAYDNYGLSDIHFNHYCGNSGKSIVAPGERIDINTRFNGYGFFQSDSDISSMNGDLFVGLYSKEYADGIGGAPPTRTTGNNPPVVVDGVPACFFGVECKETGEMIVYVATTTGGIEITSWASINEPITGMKPIMKIPPSAFDIGDFWSFIIGLEIDNTKDKPTMNIKVGNYQGNEYETIFDSSLLRRFIPFTFLESAGITYDNATAINSQIPFNWLVSVKSTDATDGFDTIEFRGIDKDMTTESGIVLDNNNPASLATQIKLAFSAEASRAIGIGDSVTIRPNIYTPENLNPVEADLDYNWKKNNYSIFCDLPLSNFKNKNGTQRTAKNSANRKFVLANIPAAFTTGEVIQNTQGTAGNTEIVSVYQPYNPIVSHLNNNKIETNNISFKIVDMLSEERATEIKRAVLNFTVTPHPEQKNMTNDM